MYAGMHLTRYGKLIRENNHDVLECVCTSRLALRGDGGGESVWGHGGPDRCAGGGAGAQRADCLLLLVLLLDAQA